MAAYICVMSLHQLGAARGCVQTSEKVGGKHLRGSESRRKREGGVLEVTGRRHGVQISASPQPKRTPVQESDGWGGVG